MRKLVSGFASTIFEGAYWVALFWWMGIQLSWQLAVFMVGLAALIGVIGVIWDFAAEWKRTEGFRK